METKTKSNRSHQPDRDTQNEIVIERIFSFITDNLFLVNGFYFVTAYCYCLKFPAHLISTLSAILVDSIPKSEIAKMENVSCNPYS